jgi:methylthioribose-1-phosphate isomerase
VSWDVHPITWKNDKVVMLDQTKLPHEEIYYEYSNPEDVAIGIEKMIVRGAGAIGVTAGYGLALVAQTLQAKGEKFRDAKDNFNQWCKRFSKTRPTAVNLFWAIERMQDVSDAYSETTKRMGDKTFKRSSCHSQRRFKQLQNHGETWSGVTSSRSR